MINKLQQLKVKTKLRFYRSINIHYDEMIYRRQIGYFQFEDDPFIRIAQCIAKIMHKVCLLKKIFVTELQNKHMNFVYYNLYVLLLKVKMKKERKIWINMTTFIFDDNVFIYIFIFILYDNILKFQMTIFLRQIMI